jgi:hypothetical protein
VEHQPQVGRIKRLKIRMTDPATVPQHQAENIQLPPDNLIGRQLTGHHDFL